MSSTRNSPVARVAPPRSRSRSRAHTDPSPPCPRPSRAAPSRPHARSTHSSALDELRAALRATSRDGGANASGRLRLDVCVWTRRARRSTRHRPQTVSSKGPMSYTRAYVTAALGPVRRADSVWGRRATTRRAHLLARERIGWGVTCGSLRTRRGEGGELGGVGERRPRSLTRNGTTFRLATGPAERTWWPGRIGGLAAGRWA
jgi:hypothetical protein